MVHPQFAISKWIGHSITVSRKHYANAVPDELYDKVTSVQKAAHQGPKWQGNERKTEESPTPSKTTTPGTTEGCDTCDASQNRGCGIRTRDLQTPSLTR